MVDKFSRETPAAVVVEEELSGFDVALRKIGLVGLSPLTTKLD
jgi:hypothetical protein